ncbi:MAG: hypothetical protein U9R51_02105 [Actinomycetota bacterium]|nr:hypothetical protein [Actinomycetota bacterium]
MRGKLSRVVILLLVVAGCSTTGSPATIPPSLPARTTTVATTTALSPTTTTTAATTTTIDRITEIEAIFQDLEERRLQALYEGDKETFKTLFANEEYMERSLGAFDVVEFAREPEAVLVEIIEVIHDDRMCIAAELKVDATQSLGPVATTQAIEVLELSESGRWGYSYGGEGWACEGPHPLSH